MCGHRSLESQDCQAMKGYLLTPTLFQQQVGTSRQLSTGFPTWVGENPEKGTEATAPSNIKEMQGVQGWQEESHDGGTIIPKDA
jgi:hypothetical protein